MRWLELIARDDDGENDVLCINLLDLRKREDDFSSVSASVVLLAWVALEIDCLQRRDVA